jgi:serine O-acetyltransferase
MSLSISSTANVELQHIVERLRDARQRSLVARRKELGPPKLPARRALKEIIDGLATALYPNRLGSGDLTDDGIDFFVGHALDSSLRLLFNQIIRELRFRAEQRGDGSATREDLHHEAQTFINRFAEALPRIRDLLDSDLQAAFDGDPAAHSVDEVLVCYPGIAAVINHRLAHELHQLGLTLISRIIAEIAHSATGIDIHPGARIGKSFFIDHGTGVVIGETAIIGERVRLYQAVTLGAKRFPTDENGVLIKGNDRHPILEDDVVVYAGATILGRITIGKGSTIGGNLWVTRSVPPNSNITQAAPKQELFEHGAGI